MAEVVTLDAGTVEAISRRVAELLRAASLPGDVDAATVARVLGVERDWVYRRAERLGARRLGGERGRLRFNLEHAVEAASYAGLLPKQAENGTGKRKPGRPRGTGKRQRGELLPISGPMAPEARHR